ncbi:hypothetical protein QCA50_009595 [Cerrena zonata]|uniref:HORMA domain-containing protein n=1 Tax=Cerrena zonata TaxID=2478898 RepID=A0AAW0G6N5_9APHY
MDALPKRRFATFKLFYHEHTPEDYEPPHFRAGDVDKDKWFFATHDQNEVPEKCSVGQVQTGWHGVDVNVTSVSGYLPSVEDNDAPFLGTTQKYGNSGLHLTPVEEAATRAQQVQAQKMDADSRRVVWDAEGGLSVPNSESEIDQDKSTLGQPIRTGSEPLAPNPLGIRTDKGEIIPLPTELAGGKDTATEAIAEAHYVGAEIHVPKCVGDLANSSPPSEEIPETQQIAETQLVAEITSPPRRSPSLSPAPSLTPTPQPRRPSHRMSTRSRISSLPPSDIDVLSIPSMSSYPDQQTMETQALQDLLTAENRDDVDEVMLKTQIDSTEDPIQSFPSIKTMSAANATDSGDDIMSAEVVECECGVTVEDCDCILCEGGCKKWFHIWCMGYHAADDKNMPAAFTCFDCRIRADQHWELIMVHNLHPRMMERFRDLALFRRAIKVYEKHNPNGLSAFAKLIGCESLVAGQLFKRLEGEGFIEQEVMQTEEFLETTTRKTRGKGKGAKPKQATRGKSFQKSKYSFQYSMKSNKKYREYFSPTPEVERKVLGLADLKPDRKSRHKRSADIDMDVEMDLSKGQPMDEESQDPILPADTQPEESQTQDETQRLPTPTPTQMIEATTKRKNTPPGTTRAAKKVKISVGPAVDLGD